MSKLNINKSEWLELVFEGKNKEYGAYQLRQEDGKTTMKAFFSTMLLLAVITILSSFSDKPVEEPIIDSGPVVLVDLNPIHKTEPKKEEAAAPKNEPVKKNLPMTVVKKEEAPDVEVPRNEDLPKTPSTNTETPGTGPTTDGPTTGTVTIPTEPEVNPNEILPPGTLDTNPAFPGGINEFLKLVGSRFKAPEMEEERTIKVLVYFVVEKDGTLSNISVPRSPGYGLDKEAIRVLKTIKTKWEPGIYKGKAVRTSYTLPITVKMQ